MSSKHAWKVNFIPWDFKSSEHAARFREQRISCGWSTDSGPIHMKSSAEGRLVMYWVVLSEEVQGRETLLANHVAKYPNEASPLIDTADEVRLAARVPTKQPFLPIGHIALSNRPDVDEKLGLPCSDVVWLQALYLSYTIHGGGFGVGAVQKAEHLAASDLFHGSIIAVDTASNESHYHEVLLKDVYDDRGLPRPRQSNEDWYQRLGYELFARNDEGYKRLLPNGETFTLKIVFLKKKIAGPGS